MKIFSNLEHVETDCFGGTLAIGNFDGVHKGHQVILNKAREIAPHAEVKSGVMFFDPHPRQFFSPETPLFMLTTPEEKCQLFESFGLDFAVRLPFNKALASLEAEAFVEQILVKALQVSHVVIGFDFFFGRNRGGNPNLMQEFGKKYGFEVTIVEAEGEAGMIYSSTAVRDALEEGQVKRAASILGHNWQISGQVKHGAGRGEGLGFPTANIATKPGCHLLHGIYATFVHIEGKRYQGAAYFGKRPSFDNGELELEVYIFDFDGDLYDKNITVEFVDFIREDAKISNIEQLKLQMDRDCRQAQILLDQAG